MGPKAAQANGTDDDALKDLLPDDQDLLYEEELLRNPYSLRMWWRYLEARKEAPARRRYLLFERALKALPGSYKVQQALAGGMVQGPGWGKGGLCWTLKVARRNG